MEAACIIVYGLLCMPSEYQDVTQLTGFVMMAAGREERRAPLPEALEQLGVRIDYYSTDVSFAVPSVLLDRVCEDGACLYYRKSCDLFAQECTYVVGTVVRQADGSDYHHPTKFFITYVSDDALRIAEERISIVWGEGRVGRTPISLLKAMSATPDVVACPRTGRPRIQGC